MRDEMPRDNGFVPNQNYQWMYPAKPQEPQIDAETLFHLGQANRMIAMYNAMDEDFGEAFRMWCDDEVCQKVVTQLHKDQDNRLIPENNNVYQTLIEAYNRAYNANLTIGK